MVWNSTGTRHGNVEPTKKTAMFVSNKNSPPRINNESMYWKITQAEINLLLIIKTLRDFKMRKVTWEDNKQPIRLDKNINGIFISFVAIKYVWGIFYPLF